MTDHATTGDGLMAGLQFLAAMVESGQLASDLVNTFEPVPQMLKNVRYAKGQAPLDVNAVKSVIADSELALIGKGRLLIRKSGTEPLIRVMVECEDSALLKTVVDAVVDSITEAVST